MAPSSNLALDLLSDVLGVFDTNCEQYYVLDLCSIFCRLQLKNKKCVSFEKKEEFGICLLEFLIATSCDSSLNFRNVHKNLKIKNIFDEFFRI